MGEENTATNDAPTQDELGDIKVQLEAEQKAKANFEAMVSNKEATIAQLEAEVQRLTTDVEALKAESSKATETATQLQTELAEAVAKYRQSVVGSNPQIPEDLIQGSTIEEIEASLVKAKSLVEKVKAGIEAQAQAATVPAGAPARTSTPPEGLSSREKIRFALEKRG